MSDFLTETIGCLKDDQGETREIMVLRANYDGYWNSEKLIAQVRRAIDIFERTHPDAIGIFAFDNATSYTAFVPDALVANKMNKAPGGKAPLMHNTTFNGRQQSMIIDYDLIVWDKEQKREVNIRGKPKGIKLVLEERGLWTWDMPLKCKACTEKEPDLNRIDCCAHCFIANQSDFLGKKGLIQTIIESRGHKLFFDFCILVL